MVLTDRCILPVLGDWQSKGEESMPVCSTMSEIPLDKMEEVDRLFKAILNISEGIRVLYAMIIVTVLTFLSLLS